MRAASAEARARLPRAGSRNRGVQLGDQRGLRIEARDEHQQVRFELLWAPTVQLRRVTEDGLMRSTELRVRRREAVVTTEALGDRVALEGAE
jgi:hypothetical protein